MVQKKRLSQHQSDNKRLHFAETLNIFITGTVLNAIDNGEVTALVLLDLSKAFDSIDHSLLLTMLSTLGLSNVSLERFKSYLSLLSETRMMAQGVPQGSTLGPALFNIYINDLPHILNSCSLESYVDNSKLYLSFSVKDTEDTAAHLTGDLQRIAVWGSFHSLLIHPDKKKLLLLGTRQMRNRLPDSFHITLLGKEISLVPSARDLVVEIFLSYDEHITSVVSKCIASFCQINRVKHILDKQSLITVIDALVFSRFYYCSSASSNTSKKNIVKQRNVQNFAARIITYTSKFDHIMPAIKQLNCLPVYVACYS